MCGKQADNGVGAHSIDKLVLGWAAKMRQEVEEKRQEGRRGGEGMMTLSN